MNKKLMISMVASAGCALIASCGSSSSGAVAPGQLQLGGQLQDAVDADTGAGWETALRTVAQATPSNGSVTQASDTSAGAATATVSGQAGSLVYEWMLAGGSPVTMSSSTDDVLERGSILGGEFENIMMAQTMEDGGRYFVNVFTDHEGGADSDYLTGGFWLYAPPVATVATGYHVGVFADGNAPAAEIFNTTTLLRTATYNGHAAGIYCGECGSVTGTPTSSTYNPINGTVDLFEADVQLTANFSDFFRRDDAGNPSQVYSGSIQGSVTNFEVNGEALASDPTLVLYTADIARSSGMFFTGRAQVIPSNLDQDNIPIADSNVGNWGGEFYGDPSITTTDEFAFGDPIQGFQELSRRYNPPGSVAGTFGASNATESFVGAFGAYLDDE